MKEGKRGREGGREGDKGRRRAYRSALVWGLASVAFVAPVRMCEGVVCEGEGAWEDN